MDFGIAGKWALVCASSKGLGKTMEGAAAASGRPLAEVMAERARQNPARRFGTPAEFGAACAFLCSAHAGYITGQNLLIDGGAYPGTF